MPVSLCAVSSNPGVSIKATRRSSKSKGSTTCTVFVQDCSQLLTPWLDPVTRLMNGIIRMQRRCSYPLRVTWGRRGGWRRPPCRNHRKATWMKTGVAASGGREEEKVKLPGQGKPESTNHSRDLADKANQEMHDRLLQTVRLVHGNASSLENVEFWATAEARTRYLRIASKISGTRERERAKFSPGLPTTVSSKSPLSQPSPTFQPRLPSTQIRTRPPTRMHPN